MPLPVPDGETARPLSSLEQRDLLDVIAMARELLPAEVHLQTPPNLWPLAQLPAVLEAGINDLGGIDCVDVINPAYPQPTPEALRQLLEAVELEGVLVQADALHANRPFSSTSPSAAPTS